LRAMDRAPGERSGGGSAEPAGAPAPPSCRTGTFGQCAALGRQWPGPVGDRATARSVPHHGHITTTSVPRRWFGTTPRRVAATARALLRRAAAVAARPLQCHADIASAPCSTGQEFLAQLRNVSVRVYAIVCGLEGSVRPHHERRTV